VIGLGVWDYGPKTLKIWNFTNIIALKALLPCAILKKFTGFMRVLANVNLPNLVSLSL